MFIKLLLKIVSNMFTIYSSRFRRIRQAVFHTLPFLNKLHEEGSDLFTQLKTLSFHRLGRRRIKDRVLSLRAPTTCRVPELRKLRATLHVMKAVCCQAFVESCFTTSSGHDMRLQSTGRLWWFILCLHLRNTFTHKCSISLLLKVKHVLSIRAAGIREAPLSEPLFLNGITRLCSWSKAASVTPATHSPSGPGNQIHHIYLFEI